MQLRSKVRGPSLGKKYGGVETYRDSQTMQDPEGPRKSGFGKVFRGSGALSLSSTSSAPSELLYALDFWPRFPPCGLREIVPLKLWNSFILLIIWVLWTELTFVGPYNGSCTARINQLFWSWFKHFSTTSTLSHLRFSFPKGPLLSKNVSLEDHCSLLFVELCGPFSQAP